MAGLLPLIPPSVKQLQWLRTAFESNGYSDDQPIELAVEHSKAWVRIGVPDRGHGIPDEQIESVFEPFHRVEASRSPVTGGTGLGLAIMRQLAAAVSPEPGRHSMKGWAQVIGGKSGIES